MALCIWHQETVKNTDRNFLELEVMSKKYFILFECNCSFNSLCIQLRIHLFLFWSFCSPQQNSLVLENPIGVEDDELSDSTFFCWSPGYCQTEGTLRLQIKAQGKMGTTAILTMKWLINDTILDIPIQSGGSREIMLTSCLNFDITKLLEHDSSMPHALWAKTFLLSAWIVSLHVREN